MEKMDKEYKVGDTVWMCQGELIVRCKVTYVDMQWRDKHPDGIIFYEVDEPVGHFVAVDELHDTFEEAVGKPEDWSTEEVDEDDTEPTLDVKRRKCVRFILSTRLSGPSYGKPEKISDAEVEKAIVEWNYPSKKQGEDWFTAKEILERLKR